MQAGDAAGGVVGVLVVAGEDGTGGVVVVEAGDAAEAVVRVGAGGDFGGGRGRQRLVAGEGLQPAGRVVREEDVRPAESRSLRVGANG